MFSYPAQGCGAGDAQQQAHPSGSRPEQPLPLHGAASLGPQQVLEKSLELGVPGGLQAAGVLERGVPQWPVRRSR